MNNQETNHIYPIFDRMLGRADKEELLKQHGLMIWFTGLSGSGKSTIAIALERELQQRGLLCRILDGDNIRSGINNNLGFSAEDRVENIRRIAEVGKLFVDTGIITLAAFISPNNEIREMAAGIIGKEDFLEIYVSTPLEECERRDVKGLYAKARREKSRTSPVSLLRSKLRLIRLFRSIHRNYPLKNLSTSCSTDSSESNQKINIYNHARRIQFKPPERTRSRVYSHYS